MNCSLSQQLELEVLLKPVNETCYAYVPLNHFIKDLHRVPIPHAMFQLQRQDLISLASGMWMDSKVISAYLELVMQTAHKVWIA